MRCPRTTARSLKGFVVGTLEARHDVPEGSARDISYEIRWDGLATPRTPRGGSSKQMVFAAGFGELKMRWMQQEYAALREPDFHFMSQPSGALRFWRRSMRARYLMDC